MTFVRLDLRVAGLPPGWRVDLIGATDERGRKLEGVGVGHLGIDCRKPAGGPDRVYDCSVYAPVSTRKLSLTFAVQKSRFVEFLAKPEQGSEIDPAPDHRIGMR